MNTKKLVIAAIMPAAIVLTGSSLSVIVAPPAAAHVVIVPRAPVVRVTPRVGPYARSHGSRATSPSFFGWMWSAPCKKDKRGNCRN
jgi:hypothetical protein